jgi:HAMP domain-containing protein
VLVKTKNNRRNPWNFSYTARHHVRYLGPWVVTCGALTTLLSVVFALDLRDHIFRAPGAPDLHAYYSGLGWLTVLTLAAIVAFVVMGKACAHRLAGPQIAIKNVCEQVLAGNMKARLKFRDYDRLEDVEQTFNDMLNKLQAQLDARENDPSRGT